HLWPGLNRTSGACAWPPEGPARGERWDHGRGNRRRAIREALRRADHFEFRLFLRSCVSSPQRIVRVQVCSAAARLNHFPARTSGFLVEKIQHLLARDPLNLDALGPAVFAASNSNSRLWPFQKLCQQNDKGLIGAIFDRRCTETDLQCSLQGSGYFIFAGAWLDTHGQVDRAPGHILGKIQIAIAYQALSY